MPEFNLVLDECLFLGRHTAIRRFFEAFELILRTPPNVRERIQTTSESRRVRSWGRSDAGTPVALNGGAPGMRMELIQPFINAADAVFAEALQVPTRAARITTLLRYSLRSARLKALALRHYSSEHSCCRVIPTRMIGAASFLNAEKHRVSREVDSLTSPVKPATVSPLTPPGRLPLFVYCFFLIAGRAHRSRPKHGFPGPRTVLRGHGG
jgi:hypothetical protein